MRNLAVEKKFCDQLVALLPRMRRFAYTLTSNKEDADDLVQIACERALKYRHQWRENSRLDSWVFRIIYTQRINMVRSQRTRKVHVSLEGKSLGSTAKNDHKRLEARIMLHKVRDAMGRLSENDRAVLALVCIEGLSYKESATTLGVPIGTVMSRLARARRKLYELVYGKQVDKNDAIVR